MDHQSADWNEQHIAWTDFSTAVEQATSAKKPIFLVFYTTWCPHCHNASWLFHNDEVVNMSKQFIMVKVDGDDRPDISEKYAIDGQYIPRMYVLDSTGHALANVTAQYMDEYKYFPNEYELKSVLSIMTRGIAAAGQ